MDLANVLINGRNFLYQPELYVFKSGKKRGLSLVSIMFSNPSYLVWQKRMLDSQMTPMTVPNKLHLHLSWLLSTGERLQTSCVCPYCQGEKRSIKWFSVRRSYDGSFSYGFPYVCCDNADCKRQIHEERSSPVPLKFSSLKGFRDSEQKRMGRFFKDIFLGGDRFDSEKAFSLFVSATPLINFMG